MTEQQNEYPTDAEVSDTKAEFIESSLVDLVKALEPADSDGFMEWEGLPEDLKNPVRVAMVGILDGWEALIRADFQASQPERERVLGFQPPR